MDKLSVPELQFYLGFIEGDKEVYDFVVKHGGVENCLRLLRERLEVKRKEQDKTPTLKSGLQSKLFFCEGGPIGESTEEMIGRIVASEGFRIATIEELASFGLEYPELCEGYDILGSSSIVDGEHCISHLRRGKVEWSPYVGSLNGRRCLGVREVQPKS